MRGLTLKTMVTCNFSADDWQLFDNVGRNPATRALNKALERAVNAKASTPNTVWRAMNPVMEQYADLGATDSEANHVVDFVLNKAFPEPRGVC